MFETLACAAVPRRLRAALGALLLLLFAAVPAAGQSTGVRELMNRLDRIERDMTVLQRQVFTGTAPSAAAGATATPGQPGTAMPPAAAAQIQLRLDGLETTLRELTGQIEEMTFRQDQLRQRLDKMVVDVDYRLQGLEKARPGAAAGTTETATANPQGAVAAPVEAPAPVSAAPSPSVLPGGTPEEQYRYAFSLLQKAEYAKAEEALRAFLVANPEHSRAANAQYWLGEAYYVRKDFAKAAITFAEGYERYPTGAKAPDNLLKLGLSLGNLGKNREACASLAQLANQFPDAATSIKRRADVEGRRLGCT